MKKIICILFAAMSLMPVTAKKQPAVVILTAGQSNTDGRVDKCEVIFLCFTLTFWQTPNIFVLFYIF